MQQLIHQRYAPQLRGLEATPQQIVGQVSSIATPAVMGVLTASAASSLAAGGSGLILGMAPAMAVPIIGAVLAGITIGIIAILNSGCGQTCIVTSQWANQAADALEQNIRAYFALPIPRPPEAQAQALGNFDAIWARLVQLCSQPGLSTAGQNCIADRQSGACKWHQTGQPEFPGQPNLGECWNWFSSYRNPIANDPNVGNGLSDLTTSLLNGASPESLFTSLTGATGLDSSTLLLLGGGALLLMGAMGDN
jgi:hypothetical protein